VLAALHLVRHGEVHNPDHVCYGYLPEFGLGEPGRAQAREAAEYLADRGADLLLCSPLRRAVETAAPIAAALGIEAVTDDRLIEWALARHWEGVVWEDLPEVFPGELEAYLAHPHDLPFSPEPIAAVAERISDLVADLGTRHPGRAAVLVSHQDPIQAARLHLTGRPMAALPVDKPGHCAVITLEAGSPWREAASWLPPGAADAFPPAR
jgi:broad specificity phosphatase PhoE